MSETAKLIAALQAFDTPLDLATAKVLRLDAVRTGRSKINDGLAEATRALAQVFEDRAAVREALRLQVEKESGPK